MSLFWSIFYVVNFYEKYYHHVSLCSHDDNQHSNCVDFRITSATPGQYTLKLQDRSKLSALGTEAFVLSTHIRMVGWKFPDFTKVRVAGNCTWRLITMYPSFICEYFCNKVWPYVLSSLHWRAWGSDVRICSPRLIGLVFQTNTFLAFEEVTYIMLTTPQTTCDPHQVPTLD